jgi:hypothetical protein
MIKFYLLKEKDRKKKSSKFEISKLKGWEILFVC